MLTRNDIANSNKNLRKVDVAERARAENRLEEWRKCLSNRQNGDVI